MKIHLVESIHKEATDFLSEKDFIMDKQVTILTTALAFIFVFAIVLGSATPSYSTFTVALSTIAIILIPAGYIAAFVLARITEE
jgi:hypothetical protein